MVPGGSRLSNNRLTDGQSNVSRATGFLSGSAPRFWQFVRALVGRRLLLRVRACLSLAGLVVCYKPAVRRGFVVLPRLFAQCLALEGFSHLGVVSVSWDPRPREPVEGVLRATSVLELAANAHPLLPSARGSSSGSSVSDGLRRRLWRRVVVSSSESECCELLYPSELRVVFCKSSGSVGGGVTFGVPGGGPKGRVVIAAMVEVEKMLVW
ncbi:hypothetical protein Taro_028412 [Colocasia esculenta]|uniref:Uncharacterized protein n=1 Tax=Colocasia esculenta TaxID=4460 RepID=A0A843VN30_COLES|nr:hypothetical protein [Colocasia esculenta]